MIRKASYFRSCINAAFTFVIILMFDVLLLNSAILVPNHSFILFANIQHYSHQIYNLLFSIVYASIIGSGLVYTVGCLFSRDTNFMDFIDFWTSTKFVSLNYRKSYHDTDCRLKKNVDLWKLFPQTFFSPFAKFVALEKRHSTVVSWYKALTTSADALIKHLTDLLECFNLLTFSGSIY